MKITHKNGEVTDTDKLSDIDAMLIEKAKEIRDISKQSNRQLFLLTECTRNVGVFWNLSGETSDEEMKNLHKFLDDQLKAVSNNVFRVVYKNTEGKYVMINNGSIDEI